MLWYGQPMSSLAASCLIIVFCLIALGFKVVFDQHRKTVELLVRSGSESAESLRKSHETMLTHLKEAAPIGGLPRDLWLEQHELKSREMTLREEQLAIEAPLRKQALEHRLRKQGRLSGRAQLSNPEN
tara:strand:- start:3113 stop:3496 length:384 start_codon:yes stop_codon:yes gene_type:complete